MGAYPDCKNPYTRHLVTLRLAEIFHNSNHGSEEVEELKATAEKIRIALEKISPIIQRATQAVCPKCEDICCISKHGYYNFEDLLYMHALGLQAPQHESGRADLDPCPFLSESGCRMDRSVRPSGCNWYFCNALLDDMEKMPGYREFDDALKEVAELWINMMEQFAKIAPSSDIRNE